MKKDTCERCGKELGVFARTYQINKPRLNIQYDCLCSSCYKTLSQGIDLIEKMRADMLTTLKNNYRVTKLGSVDIDTLIFLAVAVVLNFAPRFTAKDNPLFMTFINREEADPDFTRDLARIVYRLLSFGFSANLADAELMSFPKYFNNTTLWIKQIQANCSDTVPRVWVNAFLSARGIVLQQIEGLKTIAISFPSDMEIRYATKQQEGIQAINLTSVKYVDKGLDDDKFVSLYSNDEVPFKKLVHMIDKYNEHLKERHERKRRTVLNILGEKARSDLRKIRPNEPFSAIHIDCILLCIVKNLKKAGTVPILDLYDPYGVTLDLLVRDYLSNFLTLGIRTRDDMVDYIRSNCYYADHFNVKFEKRKPEPAWGFFTSRGYILCFKRSKRVMFIYQDAYPNDVYYPLNDLIYQGMRYIQLPTENNQSETVSVYETFEGLIFFGKDIETIGEMGQFFSKNNRYFQMDRYVAEEKRIYADREAVIEVKRISDHLFRDFGYIPFCLYSEWAAIQKAIGEDDALLSYLMDTQNEGQPREPRSETSYTARIARAFAKGGRDLMQSLKIKDESVARGILWTYFDKSLTTNLSREWIRLGGDIVQDGDSLERAFDRYASLTELDPDKAYYLGLFIYYLMAKRILPDDSFLVNYDRALPVYIHCHRKVEYDQGVDMPAAMFESIKDNSEAHRDSQGRARTVGDERQSIDDWALTQAEADARAKAEKPHSEKITETQTVTKKVLNDEGEIVEVTEEVTVTPLEIVPEGGETSEVSAVDTQANDANGEVKNEAVSESDPEKPLATDENQPNDARHHWWRGRRKNKKELNQ